MQVQTVYKSKYFPLLFWIVYFLYEWIGQATIANEYQRYLINACVIVPLVMAATYITVHVLIRNYYFKSQKTKFWLGFFATMIMIVLLRRAFNYYYTYPLYWPIGQSTTSFLFPPKIIIEAVSTYLIVALYAMFHFMRAWYEEKRISESLQKDKVEAQLELLKSQVHPHFIFNTLNNIYSLAQSNNPRTAELIHRLSALLSYMLYDSKQTLIPLSKELEYIQNYIELEKIRYGSKLDVQLNIFDDVSGVFISPLLLLPLVENSFKHGTCDNTGNSWIRIDITTHNDSLNVKIENSMPEEKKPAGDKNGIGMENVRKRLEYTSPGKYELKHIHDANSFLVILRIENVAA